MKGQLSSCLTISTISCSQADSSWTPWFLPDERRLDEEGEAERTGLVGLGVGAASEEGVDVTGFTGVWLKPNRSAPTDSLPADCLLRDS